MTDVMFELRELVAEMNWWLSARNVLCEFGKRNKEQIVSTLDDLTGNVALYSVQKEVANLMFEIWEENEDDSPYIRKKRVQLEEFLTDDIAC